MGSLERSACDISKLNTCIKKLQKIIGAKIKFLMFKKNPSISTNSSATDRNRKKYYVSQLSYFHAYDVI